MGSYTGTDGRDTLTPYTLSAGVTADPAGSKPSDADDIINGLGENDVIGGGGGADVINGGAGDDTVEDRAIAAGMTNSGNVIHGNGGKDNIDVAIRDTGGVNPATNTAWGDDGNDTVALTYHVAGDQFSWPGQRPTGPITLHGGAGNDTVGVYGSVDTFGLDMAETTVFLYGEGGNDNLDASSYDPNSDGSPYRGNNPDYLYEGPGDDAYRVFEMKDEVIEKAGEGYDSIDANGTDYTLGPDIEKLQMSYNFLDFPGPRGFHGTGNALDNLIIGSDRDEALDGGGGADTIYGSMTGVINYGMLDQDTVHGGAGNDTIYGAGSALQDGADQLYGDDGNDRIFALVGDDQVYGGAGDDELAGQAGNDVLIAGDGNDRLGGGTGNDRLYGQGGGDVLTGRAGADLRGQTCSTARAATTASSTRRRTIRRRARLAATRSSDSATSARPRET